MTTVRPSSDADRMQLKAAARRAVQLAGGVSSAEHITRVRAPALSKFQSPSDEQFMPADVILDIERDIGSPVVTATLAAMQGYRLVRDDGAEGEGGVPGMAEMARLIKESADVTTALAEALEDGRIDRAEALGIAREVEENVLVLRRLQTLVDKAAARQPKT